MRRAVGRELFAAPGTEKKFEPYFDVGTGRYYKYRADQQRDYKAKGMVGLTGREQRERWDNGLRNPHGKQPTESQKRARWEKAVGKAHKRIAENRRIVV